MHTRKNGIVIDLGPNRYPKGIKVQQHRYPATKTVGFVELYNKRLRSWIITKATDRAEIEKLVKGGYETVDAWDAEVTA